VFTRIVKYAIKTENSLESVFIEERKNWKHLTYQNEREKTDFRCYLVGRTETETERMYRFFQIFRSVLTFETFGCALVSPQAKRGVQ